MSSNTKDWAAWINTMPGSEHKLIVTGKVETEAGNLVPVLREAVPQGINPAILLLELTIEVDGDFGTQDIAFRDARFEKPAKAGQYSNVEILENGEVLAGVEVTEAS